MLAQWKKICLQCRRPGFNPWIGEIPWRRKWQPTPGLLPGKSHWLSSLVGYSPWGCKESNMTEWLHFTSLHVHWVCDAIQPSHPLSSPFPSAFNFSQHQGLFQWAGCLHQVTKILELQLQHQSFQWVFQGWFPLRSTGLISLLSNQWAIPVAITKRATHNHP